MGLDDVKVKELWIESKRRESRQVMKMRLISIISVIVFLFIWQFVVDQGIMDSRTLPSPSKVLDTFILKFSSKAPDGNTLPTNIFASLQIAMLGFFAAIIVGIPLGLVMGWYKWANRFLTPLFELVRPVPPIAWIPLVVLWMGIGLEAKALIIFFSAFVPCVINAYTGVQLTNETLINVSKTFGASNF